MDLEEGDKHSDHHSAYQSTRKFRNPEVPEQSNRERKGAGRERETIDTGRKHRRKEWETAK